MTIHRRDAGARNGTGMDEGMDRTGGAGGGTGANGQWDGRDGPAGYDERVREGRAKATDRAKHAKSLGDEAETRALAIESARLLRDDKCEHIVVLDVRELSEVTDFLVIASGTSDRQMNSALDDVQELGEGKGWPSFRTSTDERSTWLLVDFVDVVVHLFEPNTRAFYDLEMMWGDAKRVEWQRPHDASGGSDVASDGGEDEGGDVE
jgi:ribosome-associated protein